MSKSRWWAILNYSTVILQNRNQSMATKKNFPRKTAEHVKLIAQEAQERTKRKLDLLEWPFELEEQNILDEGLDTKNNAELVALDSKIDGLHRSKFESNCEKEL